MGKPEVVCGLQSLQARKQVVQEITRVGLTPKSEMNFSLTLLGLAELSLGR